MKLESEFVNLYLQDGMTDGLRNILVILFGAMLSQQFFLSLMYLACLFHSRKYATCEYAAMYKEFF